MEIKDYLHLYIGSEVSVTNIEGRYTTLLDYEFLTRFYDEDDDRFMDDPKPILRQLSSMTDEEAIEFADILGNSSHLSIESKIAQVMEVLPNILYKQTNIHGINWIRATIWLLSKSFDLFGLIENGLAIDLETIKQ